MGAANAFIEGDNLDVLQSLTEASFDLIYIDPPYNTGNAFAYRDSFGAGARGHAAWVDFMRPRLVEARRVLAASGALWMSIDDNEVAHARLLLDEVFGEANFLAQVVVNLNPKGRQLGGGFATSHEYLLVYARDARACVLDASTADAVDPRDFPKVASDGRRFRLLPLRNTNKKFNPATARTLHYPLFGDPGSGRVATSPFDGAVEVWPVFGDGTDAVWRWSAPLVDQRLDDVVCRVVKGVRGDRVDIAQRDWLDVEGGRRKKLTTIWLAEEIGSTDTAVAELKDLIGHVFETPKPTGLIRRILATMPPDARVLDFFAGSGTTGHAVAAANEEDGGSRSCLSVNLAELTRDGSNAERAGFATVADVTRARLAAVAVRHGGGFAVLPAPRAPRFETGTAIRCRMRKWGDRPHWEFDAVYLGADEHGDWVGVAAGTVFTRPDAEFVLPADSVTLAPDTWSMPTFYADEPPPGQRVKMYVDMATPPVWDGATVTSVDLDLDVVLLYSGDLMIDDEDEFAEHQVTFGYPAELIAAAETSARQVRDAIAGELAPYDGDTAQRWLAALATWAAGDPEDR